MNIVAIREYVANAYPGPSWKTRCNMMSDQQVIAIYYSLQNRKKNKPKPVNQGKKQSDPGYQFTIYDFMEGENNG